MSVTKVRLAKEFRGELVLPGDHILNSRQPVALLEDKEFECPETKAMLKRGLLSVVGKTTQNSKTAVPNKLDISNETKMTSWDMEKQTLLDKDGSKKEALQRVNSTEMKTQVSPTNIDLEIDEEPKISKKKDIPSAYVIYKNAKGQEIRREPKGRGRPPKNAKKDGRNIIIYVDEDPDSTEEKETSDAFIENKNIDNVEFVDEVQEKERQQKRFGKATQNEEIQ